MMMKIVTSPRGRARVSFTSIDFRDVERAQKVKAILSRRPGDSDLEIDPTDSGWYGAIVQAAHLMLADHAVLWGLGYGSDDGLDYLNAAIDTVQFLDAVMEGGFAADWAADNPWSEEPMTYRQWLEAPVDTWGACDGEIRFQLFPKRGEL